MAVATSTAIAIVHRFFKLSTQELQNPPQWASMFSWPLVSGTVALLALIVVHWACTMACTAMLFLLFAAGQSSAEIDVGLSDFHLTKLGVLACAGIVTDMLLMWRLWVCSSQSQIVVVPLVLSLLVFIVLASEFLVLYFDLRANCHLVI
ncbi:hypothetical protein FA15DRAFT_653591 [Coprinopsis marcescibilis]|uniref:Uncharacterized protein n=1 Tax=Coprinopsis marcescibilis TaxID=230819 RepID=A0A5C3L465_COPMA|nr:hypothetical protein FA15DRAFT_653591 [Coprinopsis marcescibilis]